ncbi:hypothetical protein KI387_005378, partial [Taxus chinensis]
IAEDCSKMKNLYVEAVLPVDLNKNTSWFQYPGVWTTYILILFFSWLIVLSLFSCTAGMAWTIVHLAHSAVTYHFFHWKKGTPFSEDQGIYNMLTWWEQMDNGKQLTRNRKFLTAVPLVLYLIASHTTDYKNPWLFFNTLAVIVLEKGVTPFIKRLSGHSDRKQRNVRCHIKAIRDWETRPYGSFETNLTNLLLIVYTLGNTKNVFVRFYLFIDDVNSNSNFMALLIFILINPLCS